MATRTTECPQAVMLIKTTVDVLVPYYGSSDTISMLPQQQWLSLQPAGHIVCGCCHTEGNRAVLLLLK